jgi:hypothetical protein
LRIPTTSMLVVVNGGSTNCCIFLNFIQFSKFDKVESSLWESDILITLILGNSEEVYRFNDGISFEH